MTPPAIDRRTFVGACAAGCAVIALQGCASLVTHPVPVTAGQARLLISEYPELASPTGAIRIQPAGVDDPLFVLATADGRFDVVSTICTHRGCAVDAHADRLVCPCHGSTYDRVGNVLKGPAQRALARFPVERTGDVLLITLTP